MARTLEFWLRGPTSGTPPLLQPVAHALLQAEKEVTESLINFPSDLLFVKPFNMASVGFHLKHLTGVLDRLFTYAREESLVQKQLDYLASEEHNEPLDTRKLVIAFKIQVDLAYDELSTYAEKDLLVTRFVGREKIPSTVIGLLFHAAEHTMRHTGQLLVLSKTVTELAQKNAD